MCAAVGDASFGGHLSFTMSEAGDNAIGHSVEMGTAATWSADRGKQRRMRTVTVPCRPLSQFLATAGLEYVDLFSLDVEMQELKVLKTIDWKRFRFGVAFVELECPGKVNAISVQDARVRHLLSKHGYEFLMRVRGNDVWIDRSLPWVRQGAERAIEAARSRKMLGCMLDRECGDGKGAVFAWTPSHGQQ